MSHPATKPEIFGCHHFISPRAKSVVMRNPLRNYLAAAATVGLAYGGYRAFSNPVARLSGGVSDGWVTPNNVDGSNGRYSYNFSDISQSILAYVEARNNRDGRLFIHLMSSKFKGRYELTYRLWKMAENNPREGGFKEEPMKPFDDWLVDNAFHHTTGIFKVRRYRVKDFIDDDKGTKLAVISWDPDERGYSYAVFKKESGEWKLDGFE